MLARSFSCGFESFTSPVPQGQKIIVLLKKRLYKLNIGHIIKTNTRIIQNPFFLRNKTKLLDINGGKLNSLHNFI